MRPSPQTAEVIGRRYAAQHLTSPAGSVLEAVSDSLAVQAQDPPLARFSLGLRTGLDDAGVRAALDDGTVVRTHVLRPTWHHVAREDLRWLLALTSPKVISGMASRHRMLEITPAVADRAASVLQRELAGRRALTRKQLQPLLPETAFPRRGDVVGHLLLLAELEGVICSGPLGGARGDEHTYVLVDEVVPPAAPLERDAAVEQLVRRFVRGHGPTAEKDLTRWCTLTLRDIRPVLGDGGFEHAVVDGVDVWWDGATPDLGIRGAWLLPTFDETFLSHAAPRFPRLAGHRLGDLHVAAAEAGAGAVVVDGVDIGTFRRKLVRGRLTVELFLSDDASAAQRRAAGRAAERLGEHLGLAPTITLA